MVTMKVKGRLHHRRQPPAVGRPSLVADRILYGSVDNGGWVGRLPR